MDFKEFAPSLGFEEKEGIYTTNKNGYIVYLKEWQYLVLTIPAFYIPVKYKVNKDFVKKLEQAALNNACAFEILNEEDCLLIITLPDGNKKEAKFQDAVLQILDRVVKLLKIEKIPSLNVCPICGKNADNHSFMKNYVPIHQECHQEYCVKVEKEIASSKDRDWLIVLTSLIASIIGLIPAFLFAYFSFGYISPLVVFCPLGVVLTVFLFKNITRRWVKTIICFIPVILMIIFNIFTIPHMAYGKEMELTAYFFSEGFEGLRKVIITIILSFSSFALIKMLNKITPDRKKILSLLQDDYLYRNK